MSRFIVVTGPSGVGKTTVVAEVARRLNLYVGISSTTRPPREGEIHGRDWHFLEREVFEQHIADGYLIESDRHFDHWYGLHWHEFLEAEEKRQDFIVILDPNGTQQAKKHFPDFIGIFLLPGNKGDLVKRMIRGRGWNQEQCAARLERADWEMEQAFSGLYKYVITNLDNQMDACVDEVCRVIEKERAA